MWTRHPPRNEPPPLGPSTRAEPLTADGGLRAPLFAAAPEAVLDHPVEVGEDHKGERDVEAAAVLLHQEVPLELPDLVVVLLDGAHGIAGGRGERVKAQPSAAWPSHHPIPDTSIKLLLTQERKIHAGIRA